MQYDAACLRRVANWTRIDKSHRFDKKTFDAEGMSTDLDTYSPKVASLLKNIRDLDTKDMETHGKLFKHFIFSEVKQGGYGVKVITGALLANGFKLGYDSKLKLLPDATLLQNKSNNILLLSSTAVFNMPITVRSKQSILAKFNQRPDNIHGDLARIILLDSGFKEGIDLFDVKYVHIIEPQTSKADLKQAIGRATRLCGQKGLEFDPRAGWPLEVFVYDVDMPSDKYEESSMFKLYLKHSGIDVRKIEFADELEKYVIIGSVDYELNKNVHRFKIEDDTTNLEWLFGDQANQGGAFKTRPTEVQCNRKCGARPTKDIPVSLPLFIATYLSMGRELPNLRKTSPRAYFCSLLKTDTAFCKMVNSAWKDPVQFVRDNEFVLRIAIKEDKHMTLSKGTRPTFLRFVYSIIPRYVPKKPKTVPQPQGSPDTPPMSVKSNSVKTQGSPDTPPMSVKSNSVKTQGSPDTPPMSVKSNSVRLNSQRETQNSSKSIEIVSPRESIPLPQPTDVLPDDEDDVLAPPKEKTNFIGIREHVRENLLQYSWPKLQLENMCVPKGGAEVVRFTPTQEFVRHYFTPTSAYKGILLWHTVGTGKTCSAIATATTSFEPEGYTILWVTRTTLKSDIYKNMFDQVCNMVLRQKIAEGMKVPTDHTERMKKLSSSWRIKPMSYKQFSNLVSGRNKLYNELVAINGKEDPLRKTLLIIDEAHKLYGGNDLANIEKPDMNKLKNAIMNSYEKSGKDSVKLVLMTATPITNDPMELVKLLNLCREPNEQLPDDYDAFAQEFIVDEQGKFTKKGWRKFLDAVAGYVSYLSREKDARQFSQPFITSVISRMSTPSINDESVAAAKSEFQNKLEKQQNDLNALTENFNNFKKEIAAEKKAIKNECTNLKKDARSKCLEEIQERIDDINDKLFQKQQELTDAKEISKKDISQIRKEFKELMLKIENDSSQQSIIDMKCKRKTKNAIKTNAPN